MLYNVVFSNLVDLRSIFASHRLFVAEPGVSKNPFFDRFWGKSHKTHSGNTIAGEQIRDRKVQIGSETEIFRFKRSSRSDEALKVKTRSSFGKTTSTGGQYRRSLGLQQGVFPLGHGKRRLYPDGTQNGYILSKTWGIGELWGYTSFCLCFIGYFGFNRVSGIYKEKEGTAYFGGAARTTLPLSE